ncbi:MAG: 2-oxoacid:acceptor oxidoreductase family protein [Desulfamplus sp.]|nr:2-oxoacid:acceptor oxidoreductase family protein [Desulfamplus sp.]
MDMTIKIGGSAGQGIQTIGNLFARACLDAGFYIMGINDFESRVRGGHSFFQMRVSDKPIQAPHHWVDLLIALNKITGRWMGWLSWRNRLILHKQAVSIEFSTIAKEAGNTLYYRHLSFVGLHFF